MKTINNYPLKKKKILLRVDLNVPLVDGIVSDKSRIRAIKKTVEKLIEQENKIFLLSHFGRPQGKQNSKYSIKFLCSILKDILNLKKINFINSFEDDEVKNLLNKMNFGEVSLFENIRFYAEEEKNDLDFSKKISKNFDVFINDAFSASHRLHASIVGITKFLPSIAGYCLLSEIKNINSILNNPKKPNLAIIGGSKISTKINLLENLSKYFNDIAICGAMANTFLLALGYNIGKSIVENDCREIAISTMTKAKNYNCNIILPSDVVCSEKLNDRTNIKEVSIKNILSNQMALDIGVQTIKKIKKSISRSNMILWNGPLGAFEYKPFDRGTIEIANAIKENAKKISMQTLAGGGDTVSAIKKAKAEDGFSYISNAGGAFLEWLEGSESAGIKALKENKID